MNRREFFQLAFIAWGIVPFAGLGMAMTGAALTGPGTPEAPERVTKDNIGQAIDNYAKVLGEQDGVPKVPLYVPTYAPREYFPFLEATFPDRPLIRMCPSGAMTEVL